MLRTAISRLLKSDYNPIIFISIAAHVLLVCFTRKDSLILDIVMYWLSIAFIFDSKVNHFRDEPKIVRSNLLTKIGSILTIALLFFGGISWGQQEQFLRLCPIVMLIVFAVYYANTRNSMTIVCLILFSILIIPTRNSLDVLRILIEPTAQFVAYLMSIIGISLKQDHAVLTIGRQLIEISPACASVGTMRRVVSVGIWIALFQPRYRLGILWIPIVFCGYAFVSNGFRLAVLVYLKSVGNDACEMWFTILHDGIGKSVLPLITLSPLLLFFRKPSQSKSHQSLA